MPGAFCMLQTLFMRKPVPKSLHDNFLLRSPRFTG